MLAQGLRYQFGLLHDRDGLVQGPRQRIHAQCTPFSSRQSPDIVLRARRELVALVDALEPGGEQDRERQVGVHSAVHRPILDPRAVPLGRLVHRNANQCRPVVVAPTDPRRRFSAARQTLVGVHPLIRDRCDLRSVNEQPRDERAGDLGQLVGRTRLVEGVAIPLEKRQVRVHAAARVVAEWLGHERRIQTLLHRHFLNHEPERHQVVRGGQGVGVTQIDLLLSGSAFMVAVFHRDTHRLESGDRLAAEIVGNPVGCVVEVAVSIDRDRLLP